MQWPLRHIRLPWLVLLLPFLLAATPGGADAQTSALVFTPTPGPHPVGFRSVNLHDDSRAFPTRSAEQVLINPRGTRPLQTSIWYPAADAAGARMRFEEYADLVAYEVGVPEMSPAVSRAARFGLRCYFISPVDRFEREMRTPTAAIRDASPAPGPFPVIVYGPSFNAPSFENSVLCEYLASHGYIVVASPCLGPDSRIMTPDARGIEAQARDLEFLIAFVHDLPGADPDRLAVMGFSWGGISDVVVATRNRNVKAVVCLDGSIRYYPKLFEAAPQADSLGLRAPFLFLAQRPLPIEALVAYDFSLAPSFYAGIKHADAYLVTFNAMVHMNFASSAIALMERGFMDEDESSQELVNASYGLACRYVLNFLDAYLGGRSEAKVFLRSDPVANGAAPGLVTRKFKEAQPLPAGFATFQSELARAGFKDAGRVYAELRKSFPSLVASESDLDNWGSALLQRGCLREAIAVLACNAELHPESATVHASLGGAYLLSGDKALAVRSFEKAVSLAPDIPYFAAALAKSREQP